MSGFLIFAIGFACGIATLSLMALFSAARDMEDEHQ